MANPFAGTVKTGGGADGDWEIPDADTHPARLVAVIDLGTHTRSFQGTFKDTREVAFVWELVAAQKKDKTNHIVAQRYTLSLHEKSNLVQMLGKWRRKPLGPADSMEEVISSALGQPWSVDIVHTEKTKDGKVKTYASIGDVGPMAKGVKVPPAFQDAFLWFIGCDDPIPEHDWLPRIYGQSIPQLIRDSKEFRAQNDDPTPATSDQDTPF